MGFLPCLVFSVSSGFAGHLTQASAVQVIDVPVFEMAYDAAGGKVWATVQVDGGALANSVVSIDPATGRVGDKIDVGASPSQIAITGDGKFAYVSVDSDQTVRRLDLAGHNLVATISVKVGPLVDLKTIPGSPLSFLTAVDPDPGVNMRQWDDTNRRNGLGAAGYEILVAGPTLIYGDGHGSLFENKLTTRNVNWTNQTTLDVAGSQYSGGLLYAANGTVIDPVAKKVLRQYSKRDFKVDKRVAVSETENRTYFVTWNSVTAKQILSFDKSTGTELAVTETKVLTGGADNLLAVGNHSVIFHLYGEGVKRTPVIIRNLP